MPRQTQPALASIVQAYTDEASELLAELSEAAANNDDVGNVAMRLSNWLGRFRLETDQPRKASRRIA